MRGWQRFWGRWMLALAVGFVVFVLCDLSPLLWDSSLLAGWDAGMLTWLILVYLTIRNLDAKGVWRHAQSLEPATPYMLAVVIVTAVISLVGAVALSNHNPGRTPFAQALHFSAGLLAVSLSWLVVHTEFALYYARIYYDEKDGSTTSDLGTADGLVPFRKGLDFPEGELVDYWSFLYYSFTMAMCYQNPGIDVTGPWMRKTTLLHAIVSFVFAMIILGYTVNAINQIL